MKKISYWCNEKIDSVHSRKECCAAMSILFLYSSLYVVTYVILYYYHDQYLGYNPIQNVLAGIAIQFIIYMSFSLFYCDRRKNKRLILFAVYGIVTYVISHLLSVLVFFKTYVSVFGISIWVVIFIILPGIGYCIFSYVISEYKRVLEIMKNEPIAIKH